MILKLIVFLTCAAFIYTQSVDDYSKTGCKELPDGFYPLRNLTEYMSCTIRNQTLYSCLVENEVYSTAHNSCQPLSNLTEATFCNNRPTGDWVFPWDCHKYIHCYFDWYQLNTCQADSIYDGTFDVCVEPKFSRNNTFCYLINTTSTSENETTFVAGNSTTSTGNTTTLVGNATKLAENSTTLAGHATKLAENSTTLAGNLTASSNNTRVGNNSTTTENNEMDDINQTSTANDTGHTSNNHSSSRQITVKELQSKLESGDGSVILIDVRMPWELHTQGKIGQSINIPLPDIKKAFQMDNILFKAKYKIAKPALDNCDLVFHCKSGVRSQKAVDIVKEIGYTCPHNLAGGFDAWKKMLTR